MTYQINQCYGKIIECVKKVLTFTDQDEAREQQILVECDQFIQAVLLHMSIADGKFSLDEGVTISNLTKFGSIMTEAEMFMYTYDGNLSNGISSQSFFLQKLQSLIQTYTSKIPTFWEAAVLVEQLKIYTCCETIKTCLDGMCCLFSAVDGETDAREIQASISHLTPLITYANSRQIYFDGYNPNKPTPGLSENEQLLEMALQCQQSGQAERAFIVLRKLAEEDYAAAQFELAKAYDFGTGVIKCDTLAFAWYLKAAQNGSADAMNDVAVCYKIGQGTPASLQDALHWYHEAAVHGNIEGQANLANNYYQLYQACDNIDALRQAYYWCDRASRAGHTGATTLLMTLTLVMRSKQGMQ